MTDLEFCEKHCGKLTIEQQIMLSHSVSRGEFIGVARPVGRMVYYPAVLLYWKHNKVINKAGYYEPSSLEGIIYWGKERCPL